MKNKLAKINFVATVLFFALYFLIVVYSKNLILNSFIILVLTFIISFFWARVRCFKNMEKFTLKKYIREIPWIILSAILLIIIMIYRNGMISDKVCAWTTGILYFPIALRDTLKRNSKTAQYGELQSPQSHHEESE